MCIRKYAVHFMIHGQDSHVQDAACAEVTGKPAPSRTGSALSAKVAHGASVLFLVMLVSRFIGMLNLVVLARLLTPEGFGIVAMAMIVIQLVQTLTDMQITNALLRESNTDRSIYDTAFTMSVLRGILTGLGILASAWPAALYFHKPEVAGVVAVLSLMPLIDALRSPRFIDYARDVDYSQEAVTSSVSKMIALVAMAVIAFVTRSYWALVVGSIMTSVIAVVITYFYKPYRPRFDLSHYRIFLGFGGWMTGAAAANYLSSRANALIIGGTFSTAVFGMFNLGQQIATMLTAQFADPFQRALFSGLAMNSGNRERTIKAYTLAQVTILGLLLPVGFGAALTARELIIVFAGPRWLGAVLTLQFLAPIMALTTLSAGAQAVLMADGNTRAIFTRNIINLFARIPFLWVGITYGGIPGVLIATLFNSIIYVWLTLRMVSRTYGVGFLTILRGSLRSFLACGVMVVMVLLAPSFGDSFFQALLTLAAKGAIGALAYCVTCYLGWRLSGRPDGFETTLWTYGQKIAHRLPISRILRRPAAISS